MHVETSLYGTWEASPCPARHAGPAHEGKSRTMSMHANEELDEVVLCAGQRMNWEG